MNLSSADRSAIRNPQSAIDDVTAELQRLTTGMIYMSEMDAPLEVYRCRERDFAEFFDRVILHHPNEGWEALRKYLEHTLTDLALYRVAVRDVRPTYFVTGLFNGEPVVGVQFEAVET